MFSWLDYSEPSEWIVRGGRPATALGDRGLPSFETDHGKLLVYDFLTVERAQSGGLTLMLIPKWYPMASLLAPDGLVPLHHSPEAFWIWRPQIYRLKLLDEGGTCWQRQGSQTELAWRHGLFEAIVYQRTVMHEADERAHHLLCDHLTSFQRLELAATGKFRVRGAATKNMYSIEVGDGFSIIDNVTCERVVSYCLHPEAWIPHEDVALATKLALEDEDLEVECLENARPVVLRQTERPSKRQQVAAKLEKELI